MFEAHEKREARRKDNGSFWYSCCVCLSLKGLIWISYKKKNEKRSGTSEEREKRSNFIYTHIHTNSSMLLLLLF